MTRSLMFSAAAAAVLAFGLSACQRQEADPAATPPAADATVVTPPAAPAAPDLDVTLPTPEQPSSTTTEQTTTTTPDPVTGDPGSTTTTTTTEEKK